MKNISKVLLTLSFLLSLSSISQATVYGSPSYPYQYQPSTSHSHSQYGGLSAGHTAPSSKPKPTKPFTGSAHRNPVKHVKCYRVYFWDRYGFYRSTIKCIGANTISY